MKSSDAGESISPEVTNISTHGLWVLWRGREHFLDYEGHPWFRDARVSELLNVRAESETHLYWPDLDVDLSLGILKHPERYPLVSRAGRRGETTR
jgi:hypothetical protein